MTKYVKHWMLPYLTGRCFDFALALAELVDDPVFVAKGSKDSPDHVGLRIGNRYADVRGLLTAGEFLNLTLDPNTPPPTSVDPDAITVIDRSIVEFHCGLSRVAPPYPDCEDIEEAREAVAQTFPNGILSEPE